jgi:hypothetical protein
VSRIVQHPAATIEGARAAALAWVARMRAIGHAGDADRLGAEMCLAWHGHGLPSPVLLALALAPRDGGQ